MLVIGLLIFITLSTIFVSKKILVVENKFKTLFETSLDAIITLGPPNWNFSDGNNATLKLFGLNDVKQLQSVAPSDLSPKYQPDGKLSSEKAKEMIGLALKNGSNSFEWTHKKLNGQEFIAHISLNKMGDSNDLQAIVRDITDEKNAFDTVKKSEVETKKSLDEIEKMNKLMVGRELEMIELKKELAKNKQ